MAKRAAEHFFTGDTVPYSSYDATKTMLGDLIKQYTGATSVDKFAGPMKIGIGRPMEAGVPIASAYPHVLKLSDDKYWIFLSENSTAAATRRIVMYEYVVSSSAFEWNGFITLTFPTATAHTIRGFRVARELYTTGTASVNGTTVTGVGTAWADSGLSVGCRIGFGSTDAAQISTWYEISSINSNTGITLTTDAGIIASGDYVIEDLSIAVSTTNATLTNGGVFLVKGLQPLAFAPGGTTIPAATTIDNIRAVYWLADAGTVTNTISCGLAIDEKDSWTQQYIYVIDGTTTTCRVYKYNIRAPLTSIASGKTTSGFVLVTGAQNPATVVTQINNGRIGTLNHGPGVGVKCLYFVTVSRVFRAELVNITSGNTTWQSDSMTENPPGGSTTYALTNALSSVEVSDTIDRLIVMSSGAAGVRSYVTRYQTSGEQFDHIFLAEDKQLDQNTADSDAVVHPSINASVFSAWVENGIGFLCRNGTAATLNQIYSLPIGAHWAYASGTFNQQLITPKMLTPNAISYSKLYVDSERMLGNGTLGMSLEPFRMYYRLNGIDDNTGSWVIIEDSGDLAYLVPSTEIQFMFEFRILGTTCIPARIYSLSLVYEDNTTDSHYQPSVAQSSTVGKTFAWRFSTAFGGTVPELRVRLYDAVTGSGPLVDDTTVSPAGVWEKSTDDGATWGAYNSNDKANDITYIRYTPLALADDIKVRALLTQN